MEEEEINFELVPVIKSLDEELGTHVEMQIPQCCREGWEDCPHVVNRKERIKKANIGL